MKCNHTGREVEVHNLAYIQIFIRMVKRIWTKEEINILLRDYQDPNIFTADIAKRLDRTLSQVYNKARIMGLKAPLERIRLAGKLGTNHPNAVAHRFKKGSVPPNKGKKMSPEVYEKVKETMFKKGNSPVNHREVGSERINVDGYIETKVAEPNVWRLKHRIIWEQHNGVIPAGYNVQFKNRNTQDCRIENLYIISKSEQMRTENSLVARYPKEVQEVIRLKGVVNRVIHKREKDNE